MVSLVMGEARIGRHRGGRERRRKREGTGGVARVFWVKFGRDPLLASKDLRFLIKFGKIGNMEKKRRLAGPFFHPIRWFSDWATCQALV